MAQALEETKEPAIGHNSAAVGEMIADEPKIIFREPDMVDQYLAEIEESIGKFEYDLDTPSGRDEIASFAHGIIKFKSKIDNAGKDLTIEHRKAVNDVNAVRKKVRDGLDELKAKARAPLDEWKEKQKALVDQREAIIEAIDTAILLPLGYTAAILESRIAKLGEKEITAEVFGEDEPTITARRDAAIASLTQAKADLIRNQQAEQERQAAEAKQAAAEQERIEAALKAKREDEELERIAAAEKLAAEKAAAAERERAEKAAQEAAAEAQRKEQEAAAAVAKAKAEAQAVKDEAAAKAKAEADARAKAEADQARREADEKHRANITGKAAGALMELAGLSHADASGVISLIENSKIPHVQINF